MRNMSRIRFWNNVGFGAALAYLAVLLGLIVGWVMNIISVVGALSDPITGMFIARLVGCVVFPLGGVLGYF